MLGVCFKVFLLLCAANLVSGCHWVLLVGKRKKRSTAAEAAETSGLRNYFTNCMKAELAALGAQWNTVVDYTILQTIWYVQTDQWHCSSAAQLDTAECFNNFLDEFLLGDVLTAGRRCVLQFEKDTANVPPTYQHSITARKKRSLPLYPGTPPISSGQSDYSNCLRANAGRVPGTAEPDYEFLIKFIQNYTVFRCGDCSSECEAESSASLPSNAPPQWPYRFLALTRTDAPIRRAITQCNDQFFPGVPFWSNWTPWSPACPFTCPFPTSQTRLRTCRSGVDPKRQVGSEKCNGTATETRPFFVAFPYAGECRTPYWSQWGPWDPSCPACGSQVQSRNRSCVCGIDPLQKLPAYRCPGLGEERRECNIPACLPPTWANWSPWYPSCPPCGGYGTQQSRSRNCTEAYYPYQVLPTSSCFGQHEEIKYCNTQPCLPSIWTPWSLWKPDCPSCGEGITQQRTRQCVSAFGIPGQPSECNYGNDKESRQCPASSCNYWTDWAAWSPAECPCGQTFLRTRSRVCRNDNSPVPLSPGFCPGGQSYETKNCPYQLCQNVWGRWGPWDPECPFCGKTQKQRRTRDCYSQQNIKISPFQCTGRDKDERNCHAVPPCSTWANWSRWTECARNCTRNRYRACFYNSCVGQNFQTQPCTDGACQSQGDRHKWGEWGKWGICGGFCRRSFARVRRRKCLLTYFAFPPRVVDNSKCKNLPGDAKQTSECYCFSSWSNWTSCYNQGRCQTTRQRARRCFKGTRQVASRMCSAEGRDTETGSCVGLCHGQIFPA